jgi:hypothetical protein
VNISDNAAAQIRQHITIPTKRGIKLSVWIKAAQKRVGKKNRSKQAVLKKKDRKATNPARKPMRFQAGPENPNKGNHQPIKLKKEAVLSASDPKVSSKRQFPSLKKVVMVYL